MFGRTSFRSLIAGVLLAAMGNVKYHNKKEPEPRYGLLPGYITRAPSTGPGANRLSQKGRRKRGKWN